MVVDPMEVVDARDPDAWRRAEESLASGAVVALPTDTVAEVQAVAARRARARVALGTARAPLWSTEATGWASSRVMPRTVCAIESPAAPK